MLNRLISGERKEKSNQPYPTAKISEKIWKKIKEKYGFEPLSEQSLSNLSTANELLKNEAIILYINHTSTKDAEVAISLVLSHLTNAMRFMGPAGMKHYDFSRDPVNAIKLRALRLLNIQIIPVVQHDDLDHYSPKKRKRMIKKLKNKTKSLLKKPRGIYGIAPEGTRSKDKMLLKARPGIAKVGKYAPKDLKYLPIAIIYDTQSDQPTIVVSKATTLKNLVDSNNTTLPKEENERAQKAADLFMYYLSNLTPKNLRGYYEDYKI